MQILLILIGVHGSAVPAASVGGGMTGAPRGVMIPEGRMPVAVYCVIICARFTCRPEDLAALFVISTRPAIALPPFFVWTGI